MNNYCVYKHTCPCGKVYIGITKQNPLARWRNGLGYRYNEHFFNAILKYGWDNISHEILYTGLTAEEAAEKEIALISEYRSTESKYGYNAAQGGFNPDINIIARAKISKSMIEQYESGKRARVRSEEAKHKTSRTLKQRFASGELVRVITDEQRQKMSETRRGKKLTEEQKAKIRQSSHRKTVIQYDGENVVAIYSGVRAAGRETGIDYTGIIKALKGNKRTAGGYVWKYNSCGD